MTFAPRRTLTYSAPRQAQDGENKESEGGQKDGSNASPLSSIKNFFFGGKSDAPKPTIRRTTAPPKREGSLSADSIFAEDDTSPKLRASGRKPNVRPTEAAEGAEGEEEGVPATLEERNRATMQPVLDPRPKARVRWERKMVIRELRSRGRLSKTEEIMRTERESLSKSHWFKTSIKKLGPLARQIAGKNIDEAILQMRFSSKKAAKDVREHLEHAKNIAVVRSGMGLGGPGVATPAGSQDEDASATATPQKPINIVLKTGKQKKITDPSSIYISQAWVNRGPYGVDYDHRARGQINILRPPYTSLTVLLKEEHSRVREWQDRESNEQRKRKSRFWTHLPDRKVYAQNQYYSW